MDIMIRRSALGSIALSLLLALAGCGGGGGGGASETPAPDRGEKAGLFLMGTIASIDSTRLLLTNGITHSLAPGIDVGVNNRLLSGRLPRTGEVVMVSGTITRYRDRRPPVEVIEWIDILQPVVGPVEAIDAAHARITIMGQDVSLSGETLVDALRVSAGGLGLLTLGEDVAVSGYLTAAGAIVATGITPMSGVYDYELRGRVAAVNETTRHLVVNSIDVDYSQLPSGPSNFLHNVPSVGDYVSMRAGVPPAGGMWTIDVLEGIPRDLDTIGVPDGAEVNITGVITRYSSQQDFEINGLRASLSCAVPCSSDPAFVATDGFVYLTGRSDSNGYVKGSNVLGNMFGEVWHILTGPLTDRDPATGRLTILGFTVQPFALTDYLADEIPGRIEPSVLNTGDILTVWGSYSGVPGVLIADEVMRGSGHAEGLIAYQFELQDPAILTLGRTIQTTTSTQVTDCETPVTVATLFNSPTYIFDLEMRLQPLSSDEYQATSVLYNRYEC